MFKIIKKWRELEYEERKRIIKEVGKDDKIFNTVQQDFDMPNETSLKIKKALVSTEGAKKPSFFEAFLSLYPYSLSLFVLGIIISIFFTIITQNIKTGLILMIVIPIILNVIYIRITINKIKQRLE